MTEIEERLEELKDAICRLVSIAEDSICREGFEELDNAGAEIIGYLEEIQQYRAIGLTPELIEAMQGHNIALINDLGEYQQIGTVEELKAIKNDGGFTDDLLNMGYTKGIKDGYAKGL